jgi:Tfp pilus assembly protein PilX
MSRHDTNWSLGSLRKTRFFIPPSPHIFIKQQKSKGFALIITISLLVLLTMVAIGMLSLSTVTLRSSSQNEATSIARSNARMALMSALGELQRQMGPDDRISAPASLVK